MRTYEFKSFCRGELVEKVEPKPFKVYSSILPFTVPYMLKTMFLHKGVLIVSIVGAVAIGLAYAENKATKEGNEVFAERVANFGAILFPVVGYGAIMWFIVKLGGMFL
jgi:hypothetical protein